MDYLRDAAIAGPASNVRVLEPTLSNPRPFNVGRGDRTDVAQSEAQLAAGKTTLAAEST